MSDYATARETWRGPDADGWYAVGYGRSCALVRAVGYGAEVAVGLTVPADEQAVGEALLRYVEVGPDAVEASIGQRSEAEELAASLWTRGRVLAEASTSSAA